MTRIYGRTKDTHDTRDHRYNAARPITVADIVDLAPHCSPVKNQDQLGACTGFSIIGALEYDENVQHEDFVELSELYVYFNERDAEGTTREDAGGEIRDGIKTIAQFGACLESLWPYDETAFRRKPSVEAYQDGLNHRALEYKRVDEDQDSLIHALASGFPVVIGITVFESFESDQVAADGMVPLPGPDEQCMGGHAVLLVGYDKKRSLWKVRNSWGADWGSSGYFYLPFEYLTTPELASDFWTVSKIV